MSVATAGMYGANGRRKATVPFDVPQTTHPQRPANRTDAPKAPWQTTARAQNDSWLMSDEVLSDVMPARQAAPAQGSLNTLLSIEPAATPEPAPALSTAGSVDPRQTAHDIASHILSSGAASGASTPLLHAPQHDSMQALAHKLDALEQSLGSFSAEAHGEAHGLAHAYAPQHEPAATHGSIDSLQSSVQQIAATLQEMQLEHSTLKSGAANNIKLLHDGSLNHKNAIEALSRQVSALKTQVDLQHKGLMNHTENLRTHKKFLAEQHDGLVNHQSEIRSVKKNAANHREALAAHARILDAHSSHLDTHAPANPQSAKLKEMQDMISDIRSMYQDIRQRDVAGQSIGASALRSALDQRVRAAQ